MNTITTFTPNAHPESTSVDGWVAEYDAGGLTWATIRGGSGSHVSDNTFAMSANIQADAATDRWQQLMRAIMLFDTSSLLDDKAISGATLTLYGRVGLDDLGISPSLNIYSSNPASNVEVVAGDFNSLGTTPLATAIAHSSWNQSGANIFTLNADGLAVISKTGITKLGTRLVCDATNSEPAWSAGQDQSSFNFYGAEPSASKNWGPPELRVTHWIDEGGGNFAVVETRLHYVDTSNNERYFQGILIGDSVNAPGSVAIVENRVHYSDAYQKERYWLGIEIGDTTNPIGNIATVETRMQYVGTPSKERYILGIPV